MRAKHRPHGPSFTFAEYQGRDEQVLAGHATRSLPIHAVTHPARLVPQKVQAFRDWLGQAFGADQASWELWRRGAPVADAASQKRRSKAR